MAGKERNPEILRAEAKELLNKAKMVGERNPKEIKNQGTTAYLIITIVGMVIAFILVLIGFTFTILGLSGSADLIIRVVPKKKSLII